MNFNQALKGASIALVSGILATVSLNANASGTEWTDSTTCHLLKQGKLFSKSKCSYEASMASNISFNYTGYSFKLPNNKTKFNTEISANAKRDKNDNFIEGRDGSLIFDTSITLNEKPAVIQYRYGSSLKVVPKNVTAKFETGAPKGTLQCMKQKSSPAWEICAPAGDVSMGGF